MIIMQVGLSFASQHVGALATFFHVRSSVSITWGGGQVEATYGKYPKGSIFFKWLPLTV